MSGAACLACDHELSTLSKDVSGFCLLVIPLGLYTHYQKMAQLVPCASCAVITDAVPTATCMPAPASASTTLLLVLYMQPGLLSGFPIINVLYQRGIT